MSGGDGVAGAEADYQSPKALEYLKRIAESSERASQAVVSVTTKVDEIIEAAGGVEGLKAKLKLLNFFTGK